MSNVILFLFVVMVSTAQAALVEIPKAPTLPVYGQTIPVPGGAAYFAEAVGVSEAGVAGVNTQFTWRPIDGRYKPPQYRSLATLYNTTTGAVIALRPLPGDTDSVVSVVTPGGRVLGESLLNVKSPRIVEWSADGTPTLLGVGYGKVIAADDIGRYATANQLCDAGGCVTPPNVYEIYALANNDYVASYKSVDAGGVEHVSMCRASDYAAAGVPEDLCSPFYLSDFGTPPTRVSINTTGTVVYHNTYGMTTLGVIAQRGQTLQEFANYQDIPLAAINQQGDAAGGARIVRACGGIEIAPTGVYAALNILGINSNRVVVGRAKKGTAWNASWRAVYQLGGA